LRRGLAAGAAVLLLSPAPAAASSYLFYLEAQAVTGYSSAAGEAIFYSMTQEEIMQKPSVGFDYVGRFSGDEGDIAQAALQFRLAWNEGRGEEGDLPRVEPQVYNAFVKYKAGWADVWVGHNRPALGLGTYFDSHALLLRILAMQNFGFDRDWGVGLYRDTSWGNWAATLTTGSGAPLRFNGNWMGAARVSRGVLSGDNWNVGLSASAGETLETMGNQVLEEEPRDMALAALDATLLRDGLEHRFEADAGKLWGDDAWALFYRLGWVLDGEGRWKIEAQPQYLAVGGEKSFGFSFGGTHLLTPDVTLRLMYDYSQAEDDHRVILQVYLYKQVL
jgi:hypothetical protein